MRRIDSLITQLKAQGPSRTCNKSKEEEEGYRWVDRVPRKLPRKSESTLTQRPLRVRAHARPRASRAPLSLSAPSPSLSHTHTHTHTHTHEASCISGDAYTHAIKAYTHAIKATTPTQSRPTPTLLRPTPSPSRPGLLQTKREGPVQTCFQILV